MFNVWYWKTHGLKFPATARFLRKPNRIYNIMDFEDGEIIYFHDRTAKPSSNAFGYALHEKNRWNEIRLVHIDDLVERRVNQ